MRDMTDWIQKEGKQGLLSAKEVARLLEGIEIIHREATYDIKVPRALLREMGLHDRWEQLGEASKTLSDDVHMVLPWPVSQQVYDVLQALTDPVSREDDAHPLNEGPDSDDIVAAALLVPQRHGAMRQQDGEVQPIGRTAAAALLMAVALNEAGDMRVPKWAVDAAGLREPFERASGTRIIKQTLAFVLPKGVAQEWVKRLEGIAGCTREEAQAQQGAGRA